MHSTEYQVEIKETLHKIIKIEANSKQKAITAVYHKYRKQEIVLDETDFVDYDIRILNS